MNKSFSKQLKTTAFILLPLKSDIIKEIPEGAEHLISTITGQGIEELRDLLIDTIGADKINNPLILPENWHIEENSLEPLGTRYEIEKRREMDN